MNYRNIFIKTGVLVLILMSSIKVNSQEIAETQKIISDINNLISPKTNISFKKGILTVNYFRNNETIKISKLNIDEIIPSDISYSTNSKQILLKCNDYDCVENKFLGNVKKETFTPRLKIYIEDTVKGKEVNRLMKIVIGEKNRYAVTKIVSPGLEYELGHHLVSTMPLLLFWGGFGVSYEYITSSEKLGIYVPYSFTFDKEYFETGLAFKFYTGKNKANTYNFGTVHLGVNKIRYFWGPELMYISRNDVNYPALRLQNGISIQNKKHINITVHAGAGAGYVTTEKSAIREYNKGDVLFDWNVSFNLGYRF